MLKTSPHKVLVIDTYINALQWDDVIGQIVLWAQRRESRTVAVCNVHSVITARSDKALRDAINASDVATPDGKPIAWLIGRRRGVPQPRISGMELTLSVCAEAEQKGIVVAFFGSKAGTLELVQSEILQRFPRIRVGAMLSPPFRDLSAEEVDGYIDALNECGAGVVFVGLGCPKQEKWMFLARDRIKGVQIGVGAVFDFLAGTTRRPPLWMQTAGLEWLGRLIAEPRRLWRRYLVTNSKFIFWLAGDLVSRAFGFRETPRP